ncbi:16S rRNA (cytidine(1402)-2'-O)-methyltransferase [Patescibacteria group bacterium]
MGLLYVVSTPIGNLKDITLRAIEVLKSVDYIACEDTRKTGQLLKTIRGDQKVEISKKPRLISYFENNEARRIPQIISLLEDDYSVALVSNAGTPTIADPGFKLVKECLGLGIRAIPIPGPSAILAALVASGLPTDKFYFWGFLPKKRGKRQKYLEKIFKTNKTSSATNIIFLSPHRLLKELEEFKGVFGNSYVVICQELTKIHEKVEKNKVDKIIENFQKLKLKGEFVLVFKT